uniref:pectate lyase family protein n=1 Tax=uncultured Sphingomonas sp. TaxID=158754 RepID=UPI0035CB0551
MLAGCAQASGASAPPRPQPVAGQPAFPGAIGYGAASRGGRGGAVLAVTTLANAGPGSLRACIDAVGPRTCVFRVSGVIRFTTSRPIIQNPFLTIAGQTAPGGGITIAHGGGPLGRTPILIKGTHDIVIRDIRVRNDRIGGSRGSEDSFTIEDSENVILDHVSASWARDELVNGYADNDRITISNSIFAQGIPRHDKCALLASDPQGPQHLSFIGNLCAHNGDRNPDLNFPPNSCVEIVNNVLYNAQSEFAEIWESFGGAPVSLIGNTFVAGPNTGRNAVGIARNIVGSRGAARVYLWDNSFIGNFVYVSPLIPAVEYPTPNCPGTVTAKPAKAGYDSVLQNAGAFPRDALDVAMVSDVRARSGRIIQQPGVIDVPAAGTPYPDADRDGMDDTWEVAHRADPTRFDAWADGDANGVANLDQFLDELARRRFGGTPY